MKKKDYVFNGPKITVETGRDNEWYEFDCCNFESVVDIVLVGFEGVIFKGYGTHFNPSGTNINLNNCKQVKFENVYFHDRKLDLKITHADTVLFDNVWYAKNISLQTQKCGKIECHDSGLTFDTSKVKANTFAISASQIDVRDLNMAGISQNISIGATNVFDVQKFIVRKGVKLFLDQTYDTAKNLRKVLSYQR